MTTTTPPLWVTVFVAVVALTPASTRAQAPAAARERRAPAAPRAPAREKQPAFHVEESTIADVHRAIQSGETTCRTIVQACVDRARTYRLVHAARDEGRRARDAGAAQASQQAHVIVMLQNFADELRRRVPLGK